MEEQWRREGQYCAVQRVIQHRQEMAFYKGAAVEKRRMMQSFGSIFKQIMKVASVRAPHQVLQAFLMKCDVHRRSSSPPCICVAI